MGPATTRTLELPTARVRVREQGIGDTTIVLAADPPNVVEHYDRLLNTLSAHARVVVVELPGFGFSRWRRRTRFSADAVAAVTLDLVQDLDAAPAVLAFPCVAAYAAVDAVRQRPDLVRALVLIQAPSFPEARRWARRVDPGGILATPLLGQAAMAVGARHVARKWIENALPRGSDLSQGHVSVADDALRRGARFPLASAFQDLFRGPPPHLAAATCPTLIIWGDADRSHRRTDKESSFSLAPHARHATFHHCGHFPELEDPVRFRDEVLALLR